MKRTKLAVTGGPSGGKTTLIEAIKKEIGHQVTVIPEAATILYRGGFPRRKDPQGLAHVQKAIFFTQKELESLFEDETSSPLIVCDRGSVDGVAYWPHPENEFYKAIASTKAAEFQRYEFVLHLDTAGPEFYEVSNSVRTETFLEAFELNRRIREAWSGHPQRITISSDADFLSKMTLCLSVIESILKGLSYDSILKNFPQLK